MRETSARILGFRRLLARWRGVALTLIIGVTTLWLAATGQLVLYIHPRYVVFTVVLTLIGMALSLLALAAATQPSDGADDGHGHSSGDGTPSRRGHLLGTIGVVVTAAVAVSLIALPPATLSSTTASTRGLGQGGLAVASTSGSSGGSAISGSSGSAAATGPTSKYTVLDWATRLRESTDIGAFENDAVDVTGFVAADPSDDSTFYVTRFVVTCCAVDAQPVGVPVYDPEWKSSLKKDQWVRIRGAFATNPSTAGETPITLVPQTVRKVAQPRDPYLY